MLKRVRNPPCREAVEQYASLFRQQCTRAMLRFERSKRLKGLDQLIVCYCMYYLNAAALVPSSLFGQAQQPITSSLGRVAHADVFRYVPLFALIDQMGDELDTFDVQSVVRELQELSDARVELGTELGNEDPNGDDDGDGSVYNELQSVVNSGALWQLVAAYLEAKLQSDTLPPSALEPHNVQQVEAILASVPMEALPALAGDTFALLSCEEPVYEGTAGECGRSASRGLDRQLLTSVRCRAQVLYFQHQLKAYDRQFRREPPALTAEQEALREQLEQASVVVSSSLRKGADAGVALDFIPDDAYLIDTAAKSNEGPLQEDENFFKDEVHDYYLRRPNNRANSGKPQRRITAPSESTELVKPNRFCKVKTGYNWTQYNKTHFTRSNPPPRTVLWYEFTLFYPALVKDTTIQWNRIYRIEDVEAGFNDAYCLLVFSVGPPYADVAYRIVRKQWDPRPGAVRCSFDAKGKFKLFFKFSNSFYKR